MRSRRPAVAVGAALAAASALATPAPASQLVERNAVAVRLAVGRDGVALLTYRAGGRVRHVFARGAINARSPASGQRQVGFTLDYSGGRGAWRTFVDACRAARPRLPWLVAACRAPDGSIWAVQRWQRSLPNYGEHPARARRAWDLRLSHWRGELPRLDVRIGWAYGRFHQLFGRLTYRGEPVYGLGSTPRGVPLDRYGRNVYVDTLDSAYGRGWRRENSFLTHRGTGAFCYGFYPHGSRPSGQGRRYRATVIGPGVLPDLLWVGTPPAQYDVGHDRRADRALLVLAAGDRLCRPR